MGYVPEREGQEEFQQHKSTRHGQRPKKKDIRPASKRKEEEDEWGTDWGEYDKA